MNTPKDSSKELTKMHGKEPELSHDVSEGDRIAFPGSLTLASSNPRKLSEYSRLLGRDVGGATLAIPELQMEKNEVREVLQGNYESAAASLARTKAMNGYKLHSGPVLTEDTWLSLPGLLGQPGPFYSQFESRAYNQMLCDIVHKLAEPDGSKRSTIAVGIVSLAMWNGDENSPPQVWQGVMRGVIADSPRGANGFGWDTIFIPIKDDGTPAILSGYTNQGEPIGKTFAEMSNAEKDLFSMRRIAVEKFLAG